MGRRGPSYFFLDLVEEHIGNRCWFRVAAFVALGGGTASFWVNDWIVTVAVGVPAFAILASCAKRRAKERGPAEDSPPEATEPA